MASLHVYVCCTLVPQNSMRCMVDQGEGMGLRRIQTECLCNHLALPRSNGISGNMANHAEYNKARGMPRHGC